MRDVATAAGVSQPTVSRALRGDPRISDITRAQVRSTARRLGYRPNPFVQAFTAQVRGYRKSPSHATIVMLDAFGSEEGGPQSLADYQSGATERAYELGYRLERIPFRDVGCSVFRLNSVLKARGILGLLILPVSSHIDFAALTLDHLAVATIDYSLKAPLLDRAAPNYFQNMQLALDHLHSLGYRRIGYCSNRKEVDRLGQHWLGAFKAWQELRPARERVPVHLSPSEGRVDTHPLAAHGGAEDGDWRRDREAFEQWLLRLEPDAVLSNIFSFYFWMEELGHGTPKGVAFATLGIHRGFPHISGIDQNHSIIGSNAIDLIIGRFHRNDYGILSSRKTVLTDGIWVDGTTAGRTPVRFYSPNARSTISSASLRME